MCCVLCAYFYVCCGLFVLLLFLVAFVLPTHSHTQLALLIRNCNPRSRALCRAYNIINNFLCVLIYCVGIIITLRLLRHSFSMKFATCKEGSMKAEGGEELRFTKVEIKARKCANNNNNTEEQCSTVIESIEPENERTSMLAHCTLGSDGASKLKLLNGSIILVRVTRVFHTFRLYPRTTTKIHAN